MKLTKSITGHAYQNLSNENTKQGKKMTELTVKRVCIALSSYDKKLLDELCEYLEETPSSVLKRALMIFHKKLIKGGEIK